MQDRIDNSHQTDTMECVSYILGHYCIVANFSYLGLVRYRSGFCNRHDLQSTVELPFRKSNWFLESSSTPSVCLYRGSFSLWQ